MKTTPSPTIGLLDTGQAAAYALCSKSTIKRRVKEGKLKAYRFGEAGRRLFFREEDLDAAFKDASASEDDRLTAIAREVAAAAPELGDEDRARLRSLLSRS